MQRSSQDNASDSAHRAGKTQAFRFNFACQRCASVLEADSDQGGEQGRCPTCGAVFAIPRIDPRTGLPITMSSRDHDAQDLTPVHAYAAAGDQAPEIIRGPDGEVAIVCPRCDKRAHVDSNHCSACGYPFTIEGASQALGKVGDGTAAVSCVMGALAIPLCTCWLGGGVFALAAAGLGWASLNRTVPPGAPRPGRGLAISGLVLGGCGLAIVLTRLALGF